MSENTKLQHRSAIRAMLPLIGAKPVDKLTAADVAGVVAKLDAKGRKRETIRKTLMALAMVLDHAGVTPNVARDKVQVKLPRGEHPRSSRRRPTKSSLFTASSPPATGCRSSC